MKNYYENELITKELLEELVKTAEDRLHFKNCTIRADSEDCITLSQVPINFDGCMLKRLRLELLGDVLITHSTVEDCTFASNDIDIPRNLFISDSGLYDTSILSGIALHWRNVLGERYTIASRTRRYMLCLDASMISVYPRFGTFQDITYDARNDIVHFDCLYGNYHTLAQFKTYLNKLICEHHSSSYKHEGYKSIYKMFKRIRKSWLAQHNPK